MYINNIYNCRNCKTLTVEDICVYTCMCDIHVYTYIYMYKYVNIDIHMYMYPLLSTHFIRIWELTESLKGYCNSENRLL